MAYTLREFTRVRGWTKGGNPRGEVIVDGHIGLHEALDRGDEAGINTEAYMHVSHEVEVIADPPLARWSGTELRTKAEELAE